MPNDVKISVVLPAYNVGRYIAATLRSVAVQTFRDFEILVVDDGSTDDTRRVAESVLSEYPGLRHRILTQPNGGVSRARNFGMRESAGAYVVCLDADDFVCPDFLALQHAAASAARADAVFMNFKMVAPENLSVESSQANVLKVFTREEAARLFFERAVGFVAPGALIKKSFLEEYGLFYDDTVRFSEDILFIWSLIFSARRVAFNTKPCYHYLRRPNSIMTSSTNAQILTCVEPYRRMRETYRGVADASLLDAIFPRHMLGVLHSMAKSRDFKTYAELARALDYKSLAGPLMKIADPKIAGSGFLLRCSLWLFYRLMRVV